MINKLTIFFRQLRGQRVPYIIDTGRQRRCSMFHKVQSVVIQYIPKRCLHFLHIIKVNHQRSRFGHTATNRIGNEGFPQFVEEDLGKRRYFFDRAHILIHRRIFRIQKLRKSQRIHRQMIYFSNRKGIAYVIQVNSK